MIRVGVEELALLGREYPLFEDQRTRVEPVPGVSVECQVSMDVRPKNTYELESISARRCCRPRNT